MRKTSLGLVLVLAVATVASGYAYDPQKQQHSQGYFELAATPVQVTVGANVGWEYVVDWFTVGAGVTGTTMEMWGFDPDQILNYDYNVSWYGSGWDGAPNPDGRIIMECWDGYGVHGWAGGEMVPPSVDDGSDGWALNGQPWDMLNPWHVPSEYQTNYYAFHVQEPRDIGYDYGGHGPITTPVMPIQNFWVSTGAAGLMLTTRIVSTETFGADLGDSPIPMWSPWYVVDPLTPLMPILGDWEAASDSLPGDFDGDSDVDADDINILCDNMGDSAFDLDNDGDADEDDLVYLVEELVELTDGSGRTGTWRGDINLDGLVDATDLALLAAGFGAIPPPDNFWGDGNLNCDNLVDATDLAIMAEKFGYTAPPAPVPEPFTLGLVSIGGLALLRRRK